MVKSFDWFTTKTYVDNYSNRKPLASTLHNLSKTNQLFFHYKDIFLIDSWDLNKQEIKIVFLKQAFSVSGEVVALE